MATFRQNDLLPTFKASARTSLGLVDLTIFTSITFKMVCTTSTHTITGSATGDASGNLEYVWQAGDLSVVGEYLAAFIGTDTAGKTQTLPTASNIPVTVIPAL